MGEPTVPPASTASGNVAQHAQHRGPLDLQLGAVRARQGEGQGSGSGWVRVRVRVS